MKRKLIIVFVLIAILSSTLLVIVQNFSLTLAINATSTYIGNLPGGPHLKISYTNPTQFTLFNCEIHVKYLTAENKHGIFTFYDYRIYPFQENSRIFGVTDLNRNISNIKDGISCDGFGYLRPVPVPPNAPVYG